MIFNIKCYDGVLSYYVYSKRHMTPSASLNLMGFQKSCDCQKSERRLMETLMTRSIQSTDKQRCYLATVWVLIRSIDEIYLWLSCKQALPNKDRDTENFNKLRVVGWPSKILKIHKLWRFDSMSFWLIFILIQYSNIQTYKGWYCTLPLAYFIE